MSDLPPAAFLTATTWLHVGFQLVVTTVVYPALNHVRDDDWPDHHRAHSRRMGPVVVVVYGSLLTSCAWASLSGRVGVWVWVSVLAALTTIAVTGWAAAPLHRRLARSRERHLLAWLFAVDRLRLVLALVAACAATWAWLGDTTS